LNVQRIRVPLRWLAGAAALLLLVAGLWRPAHRLIAHWTPDPAQREQASLERRFASERNALVARMRSALESGDSAAAMALGAPYRSVNDPELVALFEEAVAREGRRQRVAELREVVSRQCNEIGARLLAVQFLRRYVFGGSDTAIGALSLARLPENDVRDRVLKQIDALRAAPDERATDPLSRARREHRVRVHPDYVTAISATPPEPGLLCVWRLQGSVAAGSARPREIRLEFWLAPSVAAKGLDLEPLAYSEN
jgi:hypothetical protein